jgi:guanylate kinase
VANQNRRCILDIDTQGVKLIKSNHPHLNPVYLFLSPPSIAALRERLNGRGTETQESLEARLAAAVEEIKYAVQGGHDIIVVNDDLDRAYGLLEKVALGEEVEGDKLPEFGEL